MVELLEMITTDVQLYQSFKKVGKKSSFPMSHIGIRRKVLTDIFDVVLDKDIKEYGNP